LDYCGKVDDVNVPIPHFGCLLEKSEFMEIKKRLEDADVQFVIKPQLRYEGKVGEQLTMFVFDPSNNPIESKISNFSPCKKQYLKSQKWTAHQRRT